MRDIDGTWIQYDIIGHVRDRKTMKNPCLSMFDTVDRGRSTVCSIRDGSLLGTWITANLWILTCEP